MKSIYLFLIGLMLSCSIAAQINVGSSQTFMENGGKFIPSDLAAFKKSTTIFILGNESNQDERNEIEKAFKAAWKVTPYKVLSVDDAAEYLNKEGYSSFVLKKTASQYRTMTGPSDSKAHYYQLTMRINFTMKTFANIIVDDQVDSATGYAYSFFPGFFKCQLAIVSNYLSQNKILDITKVPENSTILSTLKTETLYIPDYILAKESKKGHKKGEKSNAEKMMADYEFPYQVMSPKELSDLIMTSDKPITFFLYCGISGKNYGYWAIFNSTSNEPVYADRNTWELGSSTFKQISRKVKNQK